MICLSHNQSVGGSTVQGGIVIPRDGWIMGISMSLGVIATTIASSGLAVSSMSYSGVVYQLNTTQEGMMGVIVSQAIEGGAAGQASHSETLFVPLKIRIEALRQTTNYLQVATGLVGYATYIVYFEPA